MYGITHRFGDGDGSVLIEHDVVEDITDKVAKLIICKIGHRKYRCRGVLSPLSSWNSA